ncbi:PREDICTED: uncharacterized protein LOC104708970 [Camelina sativa]|uniref:Uncharacterized protein LOC104708970 n=1 Tax=Camelina sativa TaxID=90675 RepID=A0ABM0TBZ6_CAMSA|nr:PREDICTED: uncharacterized protein LOC104708970 [Camelina sativa]
MSPKRRSDPRRHPFLFGAACLTHSRFKEMLVNSWDESKTTLEALQGLERTLWKWNREVFGDVQRKKKVLMRELTEVQLELDIVQTDVCLALEVELLKKFDLVLKQEEIIWFQKSREKWFALGYRNTKFVHTSTIIRRRRNKIDILKNDAGQWMSNAVELEGLATTYYQWLYSLEDVDPVVERLPDEGFLRVPTEHQDALTKPFS